MKIKIQENGRSMVEMLGVLAIIAVLSVAGIAGYSKAMAKFKQNKTMDQVSMLATNIRTLFSGQRNYAGLSTQTAIKSGVVGTDMTDENSITNPYAGSVDIGVIDKDNVVDGAFTITYNSLSRDACVVLATSDWGAAAGLVSITAGSVTVPAADTPMTLAIATTDNACGCGFDNNCVITWIFY